MVSEMVQADIGMIEGMTNSETAMETTTSILTPTIPNPALPGIQISLGTLTPSL